MLLSVVFMGQIKLLVVEDSLFMQMILQDLFQSDQEIQIVGTARDGEEAIAKVSSLRPDVVTMDIEMPRMDGLTAVQKIMQTHPVPIVMLSASTQREAKISLKALEYGAVDYVPKPSGSISPNMRTVKDELISKIKTAAHANIVPIEEKIHETLCPPIKSSEKIITIAASTGGPPAISHVLRMLPEKVPAILIVQHMQKGVTKLFAEDLNGKCKFSVKEAEDGDKVQEGLALLAPGGFHMVVTNEKRISLTSDAPVNFVRPSADVTMISTAQVNERKNVGVILTGMGSDGAKGIKAIKENGGVTIAQDEKTSVVYGMPNAAFQTGCVDVVAALELIPKEIMKACN